MPGRIGIVQVKIAVLADTPLHAVLGNNGIGSRSADKIGNRGGSLEEGILLFNPGSASDKRLQLNHTVEL